MSASPSQARVARISSASTIPVAGPPGPRAIATVPEIEIPPLELPWWTPEAIKGWAGSVSLHAVLLLILGFWYFAPRTDGPIAFDSRLAGSPRGVPEGETLTGGLNTPLPMPLAAIDDKEMSLVSAPLTQMDTIPLVPTSASARTRTRAPAAATRTTTRAPATATDSAWPGSARVAR